MKRLKTDHSDPRPVMDFLSIADCSTLLCLIRAIVSEIESNDANAHSVYDNDTAYETIKHLIVSEATREHLRKLRFR